MYGLTAAELVISLVRIMPGHIRPDRRQRERLGLARFEGGGVWKRHAAFQIHGTDIKGQRHFAILGVSYINLNQISLALRRHFGRRLGGPSAKTPGGSG